MYLSLDQILLFRINMDLNSVISNFSGGASVVNKVTSSAASVTAAASSMADFGSKIPSMVAAQANISALTAQASSIMADLTAKLPIALPAMKAVHLMEKKAEMASPAGGLPSTDASPGFQAYLDTFKNVQASVTNATSALTSSLNSMADAAKTIPGISGSTPQAALASLASTIPVPTLQDPDFPSDPTKQITNPAFTAFSTANSGVMSTLNAGTSSITSNATSALSAINAQKAAGDAAFSSGMANLKALSFASFCAAPQPKAIQDAIGTLIVPANIPSNSDMKLTQQLSSKWTSAQMPPSPNKGTDLTKPSSNDVQVSSTKTISQCTALQLSNIAIQKQAAGVEFNTSLDLRNATGANLRIWRAGHNFQQISDAFDNDPSTEPAYRAMWAEYKALNDYKQHQINQAAVDRDLLILTHLEVVHSHMITTGPWPGNPNGPW